MANRQMLMLLWALLMVLPLIVGIAFEHAPPMDAPHYPSTYAPIYSTNYYQ